MKNIQEDFRKFAGISGMQMHRIAKLSSMNNTKSITSLTPYIIEERVSNMTQLDVFSRLMADRIIFLNTAIDGEVSGIIVSQLLYLANVSSEDIKVYIHSGGGEVYAGNSIIDTMELIKPDVSTIVTGLAASMAFVISVCGTKGKRAALKRARLMMHQPMGGSSGQQSDIEIVANEIKKIKEELYQTISEKTGQNIEQIYKDGDRDFYMTAKEAKDYGALDIIL